jgi:hypothetical protein
MRWLLLLILPLCLATIAPVRAETDIAATCEMPADLTTPAAPLTAVAAALATKGSVNILALGSGSTVGETGNSSGPALAVKTPGASFPYRMLDVLQVARKSAQVQLTVKGGRNLTAEDMLPILQQELATHHYDLVLWQVGTVEAVRGLRPETLYGVLQDGVAAANDAHADIILIDPQFSHFLRANTDLGPYEGVLEQISGLPGVSLFHRFDLTQLWAANGQVDLERVGRDQRDKTVALLNTCLGHALAQYVLTGAGEH